MTHICFIGNQIVAESRPEWSVTIRKKEGNSTIVSIIQENIFPHANIEKHIELDQIWWSCMLIYKEYIRINQE